MRWILPEVDGDAVEGLARELDLPKLVARLLVTRGFADAESANRFLHPSLDQLLDPFLMADMRAAVGRLRQAIQRREKILIYGDYDVDGTMAVVVLLTVLRALGADVDAFVPHRFTDGYGMRAVVMERAARDHVRVVLSVDTGVSEYEALERARELGLECIVTDHHLPKGALPPACAILNPHRNDCAYPDKNLSGVGVAFKLAQALLGPEVPESLLRSYLKVVAIGTIADVVPLVGENRVIARFGLAGLGRPVQPGLRALVEVSGLEGEAVTAGDVGFRLAPRLNAAGRMEDARDVIDLLTTSEGQRAREIAQKLDALNTERQQVQERIVNEIMEQMEEHPEKRERYSLVFAGEGWHRGVIGIVAQRVVERYYRPTLVVGTEGGTGVGSGRSIAGFPLFEALRAAHDLFDRYGGHAQAAGFSLPCGRISELELRFEAYARQVLRPEDLEPRLRVDGEVSLQQVDLALAESLRTLTPHGAGNPAPVFVARGLHLTGPPRLLKEKHLKLRVAEGAKSLEVVAWHMGAMASTLDAGDEVDLAFSVEENAYNGWSTVQLVAKDIRKKESDETFAGLSAAQVAE